MAALTYIAACVGLMLLGGLAAVGLMVGIVALSGWIDGDDKDP